ncbi:MAG TPA: hypothetical protein VMV17_12085 [Streptosporangiaceae bacterium]|nr:hypothetical protein [Streptosporangiaceae bacterium]
MIRTRSLLTQSAATGLAALALVFSLGGSALAASQASGHAARAATQAPVPAGVTFHKLTLIHGWASSQPIYTTGDPSVGISNGIVYLSGSLHQSSGSNNEFAVLPAAYRPNHFLYLPIYTLSDGEGSLQINPDGRVYLFGGGNTQGYSSLAGVSYPLTAGPLKLTPINGWTSAQGTDGTGNPSAAISNGVVRLSGSVYQPSGTNNEFAILPTAYRPSHYLYIPIYADNGAEGSLEVSPSGGLFLFGNSATEGFSSLAGVSYPLTLGSKSLTLLNGWASSQGSDGTGNPGVAVSNGVVRLVGSLHSSGSNNKFAVLPKGDRPTHFLYLPIYTNGGSEGSLDIRPNGAMLIIGSPGFAFSSLAGVSFPLGS